VINAIKFSIEEIEASDQYFDHTSFCRIHPLCEILNADTRAISKAFGRIPYATEQGIISAEQGFLTQEQGISLAKAKIFAG